MQMALILLKPYGRDAGRHKLKNGLKHKKSIWIEQNQCPLHQSILLEFHLGKKIVSVLFTAILGDSYNF